MDLQCSPFRPEHAEQVIELYRAVFSASEGSGEGEKISQFVARLMDTTPANDLVGCLAISEQELIGCVFFSRLLVPSDQLAFILSPLAVQSGSQGMGVGQRLIVYGLTQLKFLSVELVFTYGDPAYYGKTGFQQISEDLVQAPYPLSQPIGWLAQSLSGEPIAAMEGPAQCVDALCDPELW